MQDHVGLHMIEMECVPQCGWQKKSADQQSIAIRGACVHGVLL